ncbi:MAG: PucR family transcriptional regulator, partial [Oscillospiraceae bacterium]|nr:PucR family transcriptional regulator [Oscillospiraceae bacterium]
MSNRLFQGIVYQMKDAVDRTVGVADETGTVVACSDLSQIGLVKSGLPAEIPSGGALHSEGYTYQYAGEDLKPEFIVFVEGTDEPAARYAAMTVIALTNVKQFFDEKYDKANFIKNVVLDNILPGDVFAKARELHFQGDVTRVVLLVRVSPGGEIPVLDILSGLFPEKQKDFVFNISESDTVIVKEIRPGIDSKDIDNLARSIVDTLESEHYIRAVVGIGTVVTGIKELAGSFKDAQVALDVGKVFDTERSVVSYDNLGIARLIYQLP